MADALTYRFVGNGGRSRVLRLPSNQCVGVSFCRSREEKLESDGSNGVKMYKVELISERNARESLERRRKSETERRERIFNEKLRTIGVDKEALDQQLQEERRREAAAEREEAAYNADVQRYNRAACLIQRRQQKEKRAAEKAAATLWHQNRGELDPKEPDGGMVLPGLVGEDPDQESRRQRQKEQLRDWLIQQQEERQRQRMDELSHNQSSEEMENKTLELQNLEMERRRAATIANTNYNLAQAEEKRNAERDGDDEECSPTAVGVPGLRPGTDRRPPPETLQQVVQFQREQAEEKQRMELERKREDGLYDRVLLQSARSALLMERQQARLNKQLRRQLDASNAELAQTHLQRRTELTRGHVEDSFFSKFNTCSR